MNTCRSTAQRKRNFFNQSWRLRIASLAWVVGIMFLTISMKTPPPSPTPAPGPGAGVRWTNYPELWKSTDTKVYKWLVVECQFKDVTNIPNGLDTDIRQFLGPTGAGYGNIVDYFHDVSYNKVSVSATFVPWVIAPYNLSDVTTQGGRLWGPDHRRERVKECLEAIPSGQVNFGNYYGVIEVTNVRNDGGACDIGQQPLTIKGQSYNLACVYFDPDSLFTGFAVEEIGHGLGMVHSFDNTQNPWCSQTPGEYMDPWDAMSAMCTYPFTDKNWLTGDGNGHYFVQSGSGGPGFNVPNLIQMNRCIPGNRITTYWPGSPAITVTLAALSHPQAQGSLAVEINIPVTLGIWSLYTLEYRQKDGWDQGIPANTVLVHEYRPSGSPWSYLQRTTPTDSSFPSGERLAGDSWYQGSGSVGEPGVKVVVNEINPTTGTAKVTISTVPEHTPPPRGTPQ